MRREFGLMATCAVISAIAASSLLACGQSCLDEYPCNVPADEPDARHDGAALGDAELRDAAAIIDGATAEDAADAEIIFDAGGPDASGDAADD